MSSYQPSEINSPSSKKTNDQYEWQDVESITSRSQSFGQLKTTTAISDLTNLGRSETGDTNSPKRFKVSEKVDVAIINEQDPFLVMGQLIRILTFNICYIQGVFPETYFSDEVVPLLELKVKNLNPLSAESCMLKDWMEKCVYDALQQRYLKTWVFGIIEESKGYTEVYTFKFEYLKDGVSMTISLNDNEMTATCDATSRDISLNQMRNSAYKIVRSLLRMMIHRDQMPGERTIMMKQMYFEDDTPGDYIPQLFRECSGIQTNWWIPLKMEAGNATEGHLVTFKVNCVLDSCEDELMLLEEEVGHCSGDIIDSSDGNEDQLAHVHGTTILAVEHHTGIFMACDGWSFRNDDDTLHAAEEKKLSILGRVRPHVVLANSCGSTVWYRAILGQLKAKFEKGEYYKVQDCAEFTRAALKNKEFLQHCYQAEELSGFKAKEEAKRTSIIFGSYEDNGEGNVACIKHACRSKIRHVTFVCDGSGDAYANEKIDPEIFYNLSYEKATRKIKEAMVYAAEKDKYTGGLIRIKHINSENVVTTVDKRDVHEIEEEEEERRAERKRKREEKKRG